MATPRSQRVGIWIIAIVLTLGTLGSFLVMALSIQNQSIDQKQQEKQLQTAFSEYQLKVASQAMDLSGKYYEEFSKYASIPAVFDADSVKELVKKDLKIGDGKEIKSDTAYNAYYIGWNPKGVIFDQSIADGTLKTPIPGGNLITGWNEGVIGMKVGGVRELTIPSDKAYGSTGGGSDDIPADTPLKFIIMIIPEVEEVPVPKILSDYYKSQGY